MSDVTSNTNSPQKNNMQSNFPNTNYEHLILTDSSINSHSTISNSLQSKFNSFYSCLKEKITQKKYRVVFSQINEFRNEYNELPLSYKLTVLKIKAIIKILKHKINKYDFNSKKPSVKETITSPKKLTRRCSTIRISPYNNKEYQTMSMNKWYNEIYNELLMLMDQFTHEHVFIIDIIVECLLKYILLKTFHYEKTHKFIRSFAYLSVANRLIDKYKEHLKTANAVAECVKVYLYITKYLINNNNFIEAQRYIVKCIALLNKEILLRNGFATKVSVHSKKLNKTFIRLAIAYMYYGLIQEYFGCIHVAIDAYALSKFISEKFVIEKYKLFNIYVVMVHKRSVQYKHAIEYFSELQQIYEKEKMRIHLLEKEKKKLYENSKQSTHVNEIKEKETEKKILNINIPHIQRIITKTQLSEDSQIQYKYSNIMTSSLRIFQTYMHDELHKTKRKIKNNSYSNNNTNDSQQCVTSFLRATPSNDCILKQKLKTVNNISEVEEQPKPRNNPFRSNTKNNNKIITHFNLHNEHNSSTNRKYHSIESKHSSKPQKQLITYYNNSSKQITTTSVLTPHSSANTTINNHFPTSKSKKALPIRLSKLLSNFETNKPKSSEHTETNIPSSIRNKTISPIKTSKTKLKSYNTITLSRSKTIPKYCFTTNSYEYSNRFKQKKLHVDNLITKEFDFHKKILNMKYKEPNNHHMNLNLNNYKQYAEREFKVLRNLVDLNTEEEKTKLIYLTPNEAHDLKLKDAAKNSMLMSLSSKSVNEFQKIERRISIRQNDRLLESLGKYQERLQMYSDGKKVLQNNKNVINNLNMQIENLNNKEQNTMKCMSDVKNNKKHSKGNYNLKSKIKEEGWGMQKKISKFDIEVFAKFNKMNSNE